MATNQGDESLKESKKCASPGCKKSNTDLLIKCKKCNALYHYTCTELPAYQLQIIIQSSTPDESGYVCAKCVQVTPELKTLNVEPIRKQIDLADELRSLREELRKRDEKIDHLQEHIFNLETRHAGTNKKRKCHKSIEEEIDDVVIANAADKDIEIENLKNENAKLKKETAKSPRSTTNTQAVEDIVKDIQVAINNRFQVLQDSLTATIDEKIKISTIPTNGTSFADAVTSGAQNPPDFRKIMLTNRNEQLVEERDKAARAKNLIIHGIEEKDNVQDKNSIKGLLETVGASDVEPESFARIGKSSDKPHDIQESAQSSRRPMVLNFKSESDKNKVYSNLSKLKGNEAYARISITEDYTIPERKLVKEMKEQVKAKNSVEPEDSGFIWKLRGTPKNGLQILRLKKVY